MTVTDNSQTGGALEQKLKVAQCESSAISPPPGARRVARTVAVKRILVDCSRFRFHGRLTGIPRVTWNYVKHGRALASTLGIDVVPFDLTREGRLRVRNLPEQTAASSNPKPASSPPSIIAAKVGLELLRYFVQVASGVLALTAAVVPLRPLIKLTRSWSRQLLDLKSRARWNLESRRGDVTYIDAEDGDVVLIPGYWHDVDSAAFEALRCRGAEIIFLLHDMTPVTHPACYPYPWRWWFEKRLVRSLDYVGHYYCVSNKTLEDLTDFAARRSRIIRASVAYNGFEPAIEAPQPGADEPHAILLARRPWLMVGTLEPKKAHREVLAAFERIWDAGYQRPLVVIGQRGWMCEDIVETFKTSRWLGDRFFWLHDVGDQQLASFYQRAHALLFASYAEGFGLPILEAAGHALPVLARDTPTTREILKSHGILFTTVEDLVNSIKVLEDHAKHEAARKEIAQLAWFDWPSVVENVIRDILQSQDQRRRGTNLLDRALLRPVRHSGGQSIIR